VFFCDSDGLAAFVKTDGDFNATIFEGEGMGVSLALRRMGGASRRWKPSLATREMTSAVTPPQGKASPTQSRRPVRATEAKMVSVSMGFTERRSTTSIW
jgi:hypothetical protein